MKVDNPEKDLECKSENDWQHLICTVCNKPCADPQILPCFHVYCKECIEKEQFGKMPLMHTCLSCKKPFTKFEICSIPANAEVNLLRKIILMQMEIGSSFSEMECDRCIEGYSAVMWCADCKKMYCQVCKNIHETWREFESHKSTVKIEEYLQYHMLKLKEKPEVCKIHSQMSLNFYCETCNQLICDDCIDDHYSHHYDIIDNVVENWEKR